MDIKAISRHPSDPENVNGSKYFVPNWKDMVITVDGEIMENSKIIRANAVKNTLDVIKIEGGVTVLKSRYDPDTVKVEAESVVITGSIKGCSGCTKKAMRNRRWWLS